MLKYLYIIYMSFLGDTDNYKNVIQKLDELNNKIINNTKNSTEDKNKILKLLQDINLNKITKFLSDSCEKLKTTKDELSEETQKIDSSNEELNQKINNLQEKIDNLNEQLQEKEQTITKLNEQLSESKTISKSQMEEILTKIPEIPKDEIELNKLLEEAERIKKEIDNVKNCNGEDFKKEPEAKLEEIDQTGTTEKTKNSNNNYLNLQKGFFETNKNILKGGKKRKTRFALQSKKRNNNKMKISKKNKQDNSESETRNITSSIANIAGSIKKRGRKSKKINKTKKSRKSKKSKKTKKSRKSKKSKKSKK